jgi:hypothetical protein
MNMQYHFIISVLIGAPWLPILVYYFHTLFTIISQNEGVIGSTIALADIGGKVSSLLGTFTLFSGVLLSLSARQCIYVNSKYVLCSLCSYSLETPVLGAQEQNADICNNKVSFFWVFSAPRPIWCTEICLVDVSQFAVSFPQFFSKRLILNWETILQHARFGVPEMEHQIFAVFIYKL